MKSIKLPKAKQATRYEEKQGIWKAEFEEIQKTTKFLGVNWNTESYTHSVDPRDIQDKITQRTPTKRQLLQTTARFYDPLGLFSSFYAIAKILFQETWCRGMQWEEILPHDIGALWHTWITSIPLLGEFTFLVRWEHQKFTTLRQMFSVTCPKRLKVRSCTSHHLHVKALYSDYLAVKKYLLQ